MGMPYIFTLCLAANNFEGQLPSDWWQPPNLAFFTAEDNNLTGSISGPHFNWSDAVAYTRKPPTKVLAKCKPCFPSLSTTESLVP